jgi:four helix bundle protein
MKHSGLKVWQKSVDLTVHLYQATSNFPKSEMYGLCSQMRRCAVSIGSNVSEGEGRASRRETYQFLSLARGSLRELQTQVEIAKRLSFFTEEAAGSLDDQIEEISRMVTGLMRYVKSRF